MNKYKSLFGDTLIFAIGSIGSKFVAFILVPYYTNILTTSEYGSVDLIISVSNLIIPIASLVIHEAVLRFGLSKNVKTQSVISNAMFIFVLSILIIICFYPALYLYDAISQWIPQLILISAIHILNNILFAYTKVLRKNKIYALISVAYAFLFAILNIILMSVLNMRVEGYLLANIFALICTSVALLFMTGIIKDIRFCNVNFFVMKEMVLYSSPLVLNSLSWWVIHSISKIILEMNLSTAALGLYSAASKIPALLAVFTTIFQQAWVLSATRDYENGADKIFFSNVFKYYNAVMTIATAVILLGSKLIMQFYVGSAFFESWRYIPILLFGILYNAYSAFFGSIYTAAKNSKQIAVSTMMSAVVVCMLSLVLIPKLGIMGAAIANTSAYVFIGIFRCLNSRKYISIDINFRKSILCNVILLIQILLTCLDFYIYYVGIVAVALLLILNYDIIKEILRKMTMILNSKRKKKQ